MHAPQRSAQKSGNYQTFLHSNYLGAVGRVQYFGRSIPNTQHAWVLGWQDKV